MQSSPGLVLRKCLALVGVVLLFAAANANAEGGGKEEGPYYKLEPFTVNLMGLKQVLQVAVTLKLAKPEKRPQVELYTPAIRHEVILLLSGKTVEQVETSEGKKQLIAETKTAVNRALGLSVKEGVAEVLFESIIIQ